VPCEQEHLMMQDPCVVGKKFRSFPPNFFTQPFQYFQIVNLVSQRHQTILRFVFTAATASTRWRICELYCQTSYVHIKSLLSLIFTAICPSSTAYKITIVQSLLRSEQHKPRTRNKGRQTIFNAFTASQHQWTIAHDDELPSPFAFREKM
jgi:hypothetical protein